MGIFCEKCGGRMIPSFNGSCKGCDREICHNCGNYYNNIWTGTKDDCKEAIFLCEECYKFLDNYRDDTEKIYEDLNTERKKLESSYKEEIEKLQLNWQKECMEGEKNV